MPRAPSERMARRQMRPGDRVRIRGERWQIAGCLSYAAAAIVDVRGCERSNLGEQARFLLPCEPIDPVPRSGAPAVVSAARWRHRARHALAEASPPWPSLRAAARAAVDILPFQLEPALALLRGLAARFLIADAVGMGKTVQAGLMLAEWLHRHPKGRALVVTPAGLRDQWRVELRDRFALEAELLDAAGIARTNGRLPAGVNPWAVHNLAITSIDYLKRPEVIRSLEPLIWDVVVFDEAHALAGRSDRAAAANALARRARAVVMLTATPHSGDEDAFRRLCDIGRAEGDAPLALFRRTRADAGLDASRRMVTLRTRPTRAEAAMHAELFDYAQRVWSRGAGTSPGARLAMTVLMRRASSSATSLARSVERRLVLLELPSLQDTRQPALPFRGELDDEEPDAVLGAAGLDDGRDERNRLERILTLAREASTGESKVRALRRLLSRTGEPVIVFTEYRDTLRHLVASLDVEAAQLHGGLGMRERSEALARFGAGTSVLVATDAASEGLNLHHRCRIVVNLELPWTPLRLEQRIGRVDRIGQRRKVHAVQLIATGTSEDSVLVRLHERLARVASAMRAFTRVPDESDVAECVMAGAPLPQAGACPSPAGEGDVPVELVHEARAEAARLTTARLLCNRAEPPLLDRRAFISRIRRPRRRTAEAQCFWLFRLLLVDDDGRFVADVGVAVGGTRVRPGGYTSSSTRLLLDARHRSLRAVLSERAAELANDVRHLEATHGDLWSRRERAIQHELREHHARLSAGLLQPGLFDLRRERAASAQTGLLAHALAASDARLTELAARQRLRIDGCELVFGVALE